MAPFVLFMFIVILLPVERSAELAQCNVCKEDTIYSCTGELQNCTDQSSCLSVASNTNLSTELVEAPGFSRTCVESKNNLTGSFYFDFGNNTFLDFTSTACENCGVQLASPPIRAFENGKYCPKCFRTGYDYCDADGNVLCRGDLWNCTETKGVISHTSDGIVTEIPFAAKGCVTPSVCTIGNGQFFQLGTFTYTFQESVCSEANGALASLRRLAFTLDRKGLAPQMAFFLPCILGILAVKILS